MTVNWKRYLGVFAIVWLIGSVGCDRGEGPVSGEPAKGAGEGLKLVVPAHEATPKATLVFRIRGLEEREVDSLREPLGNLVYLAVRECKEIHPPAGENRRFGLWMVVIGDGEVVDLEGDGEGGALDEAGERCVIDEIAGAEVDLPSRNKGAEERLELSVRVWLRAKDTE